MNVVYSPCTPHVLPYGEYYALAFLVSLYAIWLVHIGLSFLTWLYRTNDYILQLDRVVELRIDQGESRVSCTVSEALNQLLLTETDAAVNSDSGKKPDGGVSRNRDHSSGRSSSRLKYLWRIAHKRRGSKNKGLHEKTSAAEGKGSETSERRTRQSQACHQRTSNPAPGLPSRLTVLGEDLEGQADPLDQSTQVFGVFEDSEDPTDSLEDDVEGEGSSATTAATSTTSSSSRRESASTIVVVGSALIMGSRESDSIVSFEKEQGVVVCTQELLDSCSEHSVDLR